MERSAVADCGFGGTQRTIARQRSSAEREIADFGPGNLMLDKSMPAVAGETEGKGGSGSGSGVGERRIFVLRRAVQFQAASG